MVLKELNFNSFYRGCAKNWCGVPERTESTDLILPQ